MHTPKILLISANTKTEAWLVPMEEAGIDANVDSAQDVFAAIREVTPDLLIVDVSDACLDGASLVGQIRRDAEWRALPIILFGSQADERERTAGLDAGADDFLTGTISIRELIARIRAVLRRGTKS